MTQPSSSSQNPGQQQHPNNNPNSLTHEQRVAVIKEVVEAYGGVNKTAEKLGINQKTVSRWNTGERIPQPQNLGMLKDGYQGIKGHDPEVARQLETMMQNAQRKLPGIQPPLNAYSPEPEQQPGPSWTEQQRSSDNAQPRPPHNQNTPQQPTRLVQPQNVPDWHEYTEEDDKNMDNPAYWGNLSDQFYDNQKSIAPRLDPSRLAAALEFTTAKQAQRDQNLQHDDQGISR